MENIKNMIVYLDGILAECCNIEKTWKTVLSPQEVNELDGEGVFAVSVNNFVAACTDTCDRLSYACGIEYKEADLSAEADIRLYHTKEFFEGGVYDSEGNISDIQGFYCDCYKVHKMLSKLFLEGADRMMEQAQEVIGYYQAGVEGWSEDLGDLVINLVQPILDNISDLFDILTQIGNWHLDVADRNINLFMAG